MPADDDLDAVRRDESLVDRVTAGEGPPTGDPAGDLMAVWRDATRDPTERIRYRDPATTQLPHVLYGDPRWNPIAFLPVDPVPEGRIDYQGAVDYAWSSDGADTEAPGEDYVYTDPVTDDAWPRITEAADDLPDAFPDGWGDEPTERDQAAIDAGNA